MFILANNIRVHYELSGTLGQPVVVLSHSLAASGNMWEPQIKALGEHFQVLRYDTRGHGRTEVTPGPYRLSQLGDDAVALLDALGIEQVHWVGLSLGGMIGQTVALDHPGRFHRLVLCDTAAVVPAEMQPVWEERIASVKNRGMSAQVEATMERWFSPGFAAAGSPFFSLIKKEFLATPPEGYVGCAEAIRRLNTLPRLKEITIPTLVMVGEQDPATPVTAAQSIAAQIKGAKLVVIPGARHLPNVEAAGEFNSHLLDFLLSRT
jgi:3-oxoadipate enol-lactonase